MNISSILITIVGIIIILALYVASRVSKNNLPKNETTKLKKIKDENGDEFTSILDDIPATDGSAQDEIDESNPATIKQKKRQVVLFISGKNEEGLDGNLIKETLIQNNLKLGDKDIYHYIIEKNDQKTSLFRLANGVEPWTLKDTDLINKKIVGLSMVILLPTVLENKEAITLFMQLADNITLQMNGELKNQEQQRLTDRDRESILNNQ